MTSGDTAWILVSTALVFFMVPGLALFYGGLVGEKNVIAMMAESFVAIGIIGILWAVIGCPLALGNRHRGLIGGFYPPVLGGVGDLPNPLAPHIPSLLFM